LLHGFAHLLADLATLLQAGFLFGRARPQTGKLFPHRFRCFSERIGIIHQQGFEDRSLVFIKVESLHEQRHVAAKELGLHHLLAKTSHHRAAEVATGSSSTSITATEVLRRSGWTIEAATASVESLARLIGLVFASLFLLRRGRIRGALSQQCASIESDWSAQAKSKKVAASVIQSIGKGHH
jgi:hypothetical protein